jgi:hypothetical protein
LFHDAGPLKKPLAKGSTERLAEIRSTVGVLLSAIYRSRFTVRLLTVLPP